MTEKWECLTKKDLIRLLEPYDEDTNIVFGVHLQQGYVGFYDLTKDDKYSKNINRFILTSESLDEWYKEDMMEDKV